VALTHGEVRMWEILRTNALWANRNYEAYLEELRGKYGFVAGQKTSLDAEKRELTING
jgi:hypothetical protein